MALLAFPPVKTHVEITHGATHQDTLIVRVMDRIDYRFHYDFQRRRLNVAVRFARSLNPGILRKTSRAMNLFALP